MKHKLDIVVTTLEPQDEAMYATSITHESEAELYKAITHLYDEGWPMTVISTILMMVFVNEEKEWGAEYFDGIQWHKYHIELN